MIIYIKNLLAMNAKQIIESIKQNPNESFHTFNVALDENKDKILEELNEFCDGSGYHLSIAYYPKNNKDCGYKLLSSKTDVNINKTFKIRITKCNDQYPNHGFEREEPDVPNGSLIMVFSIVAVVLAIGWIMIR